MVFTGFNLNKIQSKNYQRIIEIQNCLIKKKVKKNMDLNKHSMPVFDAWRSHTY